MKKIKNSYKNNFWKYLLVGLCSTIVSVGISIGVFSTMIHETLAFNVDIENNSLEVGYEKGKCTISLTEFGLDHWIDPQVQTNYDYFDLSNQNWIGEETSKILELSLSDVDNAQPGKFQILFTIKEQTVTKYIEVHELTITPLPITTDFFTYTGSTAKTITGYAPNFVNSWISLNDCENYISTYASDKVNALSFNNLSISGDKHLLSINRSGYEHINTFYSKLKVIDLTNSSFLLKAFDSTIGNTSGYLTFGSDDNDISTTNMTNDFSSVLNLIINNVDFCNSSVASALRLRTAQYTFANCNFSRLKTLTINDSVRFANDGLALNGAYAETASHTFDGCRFNSLNSLDLSNAKFSCVNLVTNSGISTTASYTFANCLFSNLNSLSLSGTTFCNQNMCASGGFFTANYTFFHSTFTIITNLKVKDAIWAVNNATESTSNNCRYANFSFAQTQWNNLNSISLGELDLCSDYTNSSTNCLTPQTFNSVTCSNENVCIKIYVKNSKQNTWISQCTTWFGIKDTNWEFQDDISVIINRNLPRDSLFLDHPLIYTTFDESNMSSVVCNWNILGVVDTSAIQWSFNNNSITFIQTNYLSSAQFASPITCQVSHGDYFNSFTIKTNDRFNEFINLNDIYGNHNGWTQTYNCDFTSMSSIDDLSSKMFINNLTGSNEVVYSQDNITFDDNGLNIWLDKDEETGKNTSAWINTKNHLTQAFGCFEIYAKVNQLPVGYSTWYFDFNNGFADDGYGSRNGAELDMIESTWYASKNKTEFHSWQDGWQKRERYNKIFTAPGADFYDNAFHKYSFIWTPNCYWFFIDGINRFNSTCGNGEDNTWPLKTGVCQVAENLHFTGIPATNESNWGDGPTYYWDIINHNNKCAYSIQYFKVYQNANFTPYEKEYWS